MLRRDRPLAEALVHEGFEHNVLGRLGGRPAEQLASVFDEAALVVATTIYQQAYVASPMETRGIVVSVRGGRPTGFCPGAR